MESPIAEAILRCFARFLLTGYDLAHGLSHPIPILVHRDQFLQW